MKAAALIALAQARVMVLSSIMMQSAHGGIAISEVFAADALAPKSYFNQMQHQQRFRPEGSTVIAGKITGEEEVTLEEQAFLKNFLGALPPERLSDYPWDKDIMHLLSELAVGGEDTDFKQSLREKIFKIAQDLPEKRHRPLDAGDWDMYGNQLPKFIELTAGRIRQALRSEQISDSEFFQMQQMLLEVFENGRGIVRTHRLIDGMDCFGKSLKINLRIVRMDQEGFPLGKKDKMSVRQALTIAGDDTLNIYLTSEFIRDAGLHGFTQALLQPLFEVFAGKTHREAVEWEGLYNKQAPEGKTIPLSDLILRDIDTAAKQKNWAYLGKLLRRYRPLPGGRLARVDAHALQIQDLVTWAFVKDPAGQARLARAFVQNRDIAVIERYLHSEELPAPMSEQTQAAQTAMQELRSEARKSLDLWKDAGTFDVTRGSGQVAVKRWIKKFWDAAASMDEKFFDAPHEVNKVKANAANQDMNAKVHVTLVNQPVGYFLAVRIPSFPSRTKRIDIAVGVGDQGTIRKEDFARLMIFLWYRMDDVWVKAAEGKEELSHKESLLEPDFNQAYVNYVLSELARMDSSLCEPGAPVSRPSPGQSVSAAQFPINLQTILTPAQHLETPGEVNKYLRAHWNDKVLQDKEQAIDLLYAARDRNLLESLMDELPDSLNPPDKGLTDAADQALGMIDKKSAEIRLDVRKVSQERLQRFFDKAHGIFQAIASAGFVNMPGVEPFGADVLDKYRLDIKVFHHLVSGIKIEKSEHTLQIRIFIPAGGSSWRREDLLRILACCYRDLERHPKPSGPLWDNLKKQATICKYVSALEASDPAYRRGLWELLRLFHQKEPLGEPYSFFKLDALINSISAEKDPEFLPELRKFLRFSHRMDVSEKHGYLAKIRNRPGFLAAIAEDETYLHDQTNYTQAKCYRIELALNSLLRDPGRSAQKVAAILNASGLPIVPPQKMFEAARENPAQGIPGLIESAEGLLANARKRELESAREESIMALWAKVADAPLIREEGKDIPPALARDEELGLYYSATLEGRPLEELSDPEGWEKILHWVPEPLATRLFSCRVLVWKNVPHAAILRDVWERKDTVIFSEGMWSLIGKDAAAIGLALTEAFGGVKERRMYDWMKGPYTSADIEMFREWKDAVNNQAWNSMGIQRMKKQREELEKRIEPWKEEEAGLPPEERGFSHALNASLAEIDEWSLKIRMAEKYGAPLAQAVWLSKDKFENRWLASLGAQLMQIRREKGGVFNLALAELMEVRGHADVDAKTSGELYRHWHDQQTLQRDMEKATQGALVSLDIVLALKKDVGSFLVVEGLLEELKKLSDAFGVFFYTALPDREMRIALAEILATWPELAGRIATGVRTKEDLEFLLGRFPKNRPPRHAILLDEPDLAAGQGQGFRLLASGTLTLPRLLLEMQTEKFFSEHPDPVLQASRDPLDRYYTALFHTKSSVSKRALDLLIAAFKTPAMASLRDAVFETLTQSPMEAELTAMLIRGMHGGMRDKSFAWLLHKMNTTNSAVVLRAALEAIREAQPGLPSLRHRVVLDLLGKMEALAAKGAPEAIPPSDVDQMLEELARTAFALWDTDIAKALIALAADGRNGLTDKQRFQICVGLLRKDPTILKRQPTLMEEIVIPLVERLSREKNPPAWLQGSDVTVLMRATARNLKRRQADTAEQELLGASA